MQYAFKAKKTIVLCFIAESIADRPVARILFRGSYGLFEEQNFP